MKKVIFKLNTETKLSRNFINQVPMQGPADEYVQGLLAEYDVQCDETELKKYLKTFGAWEDSELQDHDTNLQRLVWTACLDCQEQKTLYFYMGS